MVRRAAAATFHREQPPIAAKLAPDNLAETSIATHAAFGSHIIPYTPIQLKLPPQLLCHTEQNCLPRCAASLAVSATSSVCEKAMTELSVWLTPQAKEMSAVYGRQSH